MTSSSVAILQPSPSEGSTETHVAQFYDDDDFLYGAVADFVDAGLASGSSAILIVTAAHRDGVLLRLRQRASAPAAPRGRITVVDARETLAKIMVGGALDRDRFDAHVGELVRQCRAASGRDRVHAYGEMVDVLCKEGNPEAALDLEELWNDLGRRQPLSLLCGYMMGSFCGDEHAAALERICRAHTHVFPTESYPIGPDHQPALREVTLLQQRARALETELARRRDLEAALRATQDDLRRQNEELARAVRFSETFIGMLGHDLRNPLSAITTGARLLMRRAESERVELPARRILSSGERMGRMIDQLLDFTRIRLGGGIPLERRLVDLGVICRTAADEIEGTFGADGIEIETAGDPVGLWDGDRLTQLVSNLLGNAIAHGSQGGRVRVRVDGGDATVVLALHNRGTVPRDVLPHLFRPMGIGSDRKHTGSSGLGLGLYISQQIVLAHAGTIDITSSEQDGTEVTVRLPRSTEPALRGAR